MQKRFDRRVGTVVEQDITMECVDAQGRSHALDTLFSYHKDDPFAVTITFLTSAGDLPWTFSRELLMRGMSDPIGDGDVHVWPSIGETGRAVVVVELSSPDGHLITQARADDVHSFVNRTLAMVPAGKESNHMDLDDLIQQLLAA